LALACIGGILAAAIRPKDMGKTGYITARVEPKLKVAGRARAGEGGCKHDGGDNNVFDADRPK
jgi:hypothetical protein